MRLDNFPADAPLCASGKRPFRTEDRVRASLGLSRRLRSLDADQARRPGIVERGYYQCPACRWWHLTSTTGAQRRSTLGNAKNSRRRRS